MSMGADPASTPSRAALRVLAGLAVLMVLPLYPQEKTVQAVVFDGIAVAGYVDRGGYVNFTGPNVNMVSGHHKVVLGMMPSLRIKQEHSEPRNALVTPSLGCGVTWCYRRLAVQLPLYYNARTAMANGRWNVGVGLGVRLK